MERIGKLKVIVWLLAVILLFELGFLAYMLAPGNFFLWTTLGVIAIVCLYLCVLIWQLIRELTDRVRK